MPAPPVVRVEFCGEVVEVDPSRPYTIGRDADLSVDDNPYLHRSFLRVEHAGGLWWLSNTGSRLSAMVADPGGYVQATLAPGARLPIVLPCSAVLFSAGPTTYELVVQLDDAPFVPVPADASPSGDTTLGVSRLPPGQLRLVVALAEPVLRRSGTGGSAVPSSADAARRLGIPLTAFNRRLDVVCEKLSQSGVRGLRGSERALASNRRARLVEHAVATRMVTPDDLPLLDEPLRPGG